MFAADGHGNNGNDDSNGDEGDDDDDDDVIMMSREKGFFCGRNFVDAIVKSSSRCI